LQMMADKHKYS